VKKRRPPRAWVGAAKPPDPAELGGPRGLTAEVLRGDGEVSENAPDSRGSAPPPDSDRFMPVRQPSDSAPLRDWRFYWDLLSEDRRARILSVIAARLGSLTVVLDRLLDPHNTAAILRTSEGLGVARAHIVSHESQDALAHRRVTQDADKWLDVELHASGAAAATALRNRGFDVWAGHLDPNAIVYTELPADRPIALLFGNEHEGPSSETLAACTGTFRIPMAGFTQSFNVSVAAGIALAHIAGKRRAHLNAAGDLPEPARVELQQRFTLLAAKLARRLKPSP
jgi:tRNA (guanosine-2'-O-)-methyltransferase